VRKPVPELSWKYAPEKVSPEMESHMLDSAAEIIAKSTHTPLERRIVVGKVVGLKPVMDLGDQLLNVIVRRDAKPSQSITAVAIDGFSEMISQCEPAFRVKAQGW
jgi:hypothetical protein